MMKTSGSRRISSAMASRRASRMVWVTISVPAGTSGSGSATACGAEGGAFGVGASALAAAGGADSAAFSCLAGAGAFARSAALSPSAKIVAIGVFTATSAVPSGIRILPSVPSSVASTSMVALSVSISAMMSPDLTLSPSFFNHLARLPFSIVGDSAGMRMLIGMASALLSGRFFHGFLGGLAGGFYRAGAHLGGERLGDVNRDILLVQTGLLRRVDHAEPDRDLGQHFAPLCRYRECRQGRDIKLVVDDA